MISVIIPTFNRKKELIKALKSVLRQTYSDFELLIIDDGSTDGTREKVKKFLGDKRIKYFYQENSGVSCARNLGIKKAKGEYIAFLDSDDEFRRKKLEIQLEEMIKFDVELSICNSIEVQENEVEVFSKYKESFLFNQKFYAKNKIPVSGTFFMIKNESPILFNENLPTSEDLDFVMRYLMRGDVLFVSKPLVKRIKSFNPVRLSSNPKLKIKGLRARLALFKKNEYNLSKNLNEKYIARLNYSLSLWYFLDDDFVRGRKYLSISLSLKKSFKKMTIYSVSFIPFLFKILRKTAIFFWKKGLIKI